MAHWSPRPVVRSFSQRRASLRGTVRTDALPARPDQFIELYLAERYQVARDGRMQGPSPVVAAVGPQSRPGLMLQMSGEIDVFTIRFQPTGFHRLFGMGMTELVNEGVDLASIIGRQRDALHDAVARAPDFAARVDMAQRWLATWMARTPGPTAIDAVALLLVRVRGNVQIEAIAGRTGLSPRQFKRRFKQAVGLPPKLYARTVRLHHAFDLRSAHPGAGWTDIAAAAGYADQAHLCRDCTALTGAPPRMFVQSREH